MEKRWVLLEHSDSPNDKGGVHFDLLLEEIDDCKSWRLLSFPILDGPPVKANLIQRHDIRWLEIDEEVLSGGRGKAKRVLKGFFSGDISSDIQFRIQISFISENFLGWLEIRNKYCRIFS